MKPIEEFPPGTTVPVHIHNDVVGELKRTRATISALQDQNATLQLELNTLKARIGQAEAKAKEAAAKANALFGDVHDSAYDA